MEILVTPFWVLHLGATSVILVGWLLTAFRVRHGLTAMVWAARAQLVIGLILVNLTFSSGLNYGKIIVKLVLAIAVVGCVEIANARAKRGEFSPVLPAASAALTVVTAAISFLW
jgi:hypothetical protein